MTDGWTNEQTNKQTEILVSNLGLFGFLKFLDPSFKKEEKTWTSSPPKNPFWFILVLVLLSAVVERFGVSCMRDFFYHLDKRLLVKEHIPKIEKLRNHCEGGGDILSLGTFSGSLY